MHVLKMVMWSLLALTILMGCGDLDDGMDLTWDDDQQLSCERDLTLTLLEDSEVSYRVTGEGEYSLSRIIWVDADGEQEDASPQLPFEKTLTLPGQTEVRLFVEGETINGEISLKLEFSGAVSEGSLTQSCERRISN